MQCYFTFNFKDYHIKVYWNKYMIDERFSLYKDDLIESLVKKQRSQGAMADTFLSKDETKKLLLKGNAAIIGMQDALKNEVPEDLLNTCDVHTFVDSHLQFNYG